MNRVSPWLTLPCTLFKLAQRLYEDLTFIHVTGADTRRKVTCCHPRLLYLEGERKNFNSFVNEELEGLALHLYEFP